VKVWAGRMQVVKLAASAAVARTRLRAAGRLGQATTGSSVEDAGEPCRAAQIPFGCPASC
jgi:hypothetical protein